MDTYLKYIEKDHLIPLVIENKELIYRDLENVRSSWTGRIGANFTNAFIQEAVYLITNAIVVFEQGYFDCAYYSLRQSLEVATTMNYLLELNDDERKKKFRDWKTQQWFPMNREMLKFMEVNEEMYSDMFRNMGEYFEIINKTKQRLNKFVHKQGYEYLYVTRNNPINYKRNLLNDKDEFMNYLELCIGAVAVLRLGVDPMPVLLMDEEIYYRTGDTMSSAFSHEFVEKYIGLSHIEQFKLTEVYLNHYNGIMQNEKKCDYVMDIVRNKYIDKDKINEILLQKHLLRREELIVVVYCSLSEKITKAYTYGGMGMYFTNLLTTRKKMSYDGLFFHEISKKDNPINCEFDEAFISYFNINDDVDIFVEHNEKFNNSEIIDLQNTIIEF